MFSFPFHNKDDNIVYINIDIRVQEVINYKISIMMQNYPKQI